MFKIITMIPNDNMTIRDLSGEEISFLLRYRQLSDEDKAMCNKLMEGLKFADADGYVTWEWKVGTNTTKGEHSISVRGGGTQEKVTFVVG